MRFILASRLTGGRWRQSTVGAVNGGQTVSGRLLGAEYHLLAAGTDHIAMQQSGTSAVGVDAGVCVSTILRSINKFSVHTNECYYTSVYMKDVVDAQRVRASAI